jgi:DNA processing protein
MSASPWATSERAARAALAHFSYALPSSTPDDIAAVGAAETWRRLAAAHPAVMGGYKAEAEFAGDQDIAEFLIPGDPQWPAALDGLGADTPLGIWTRGGDRLPDLVSRAVHIAGNRHASPAGNRLAGKLAAELAGNGAVITTVSAFGIGAYAIAAAAERETPALVVVPCGLNLSHPQDMGDLVRTVLHNGGVLVSELRPHIVASGTTVHSAPRLAAALAPVTVVVESRQWDSDRSTAQSVGTARRLARPVLAMATAEADGFNPGNEALIANGLAVAAEQSPDGLRAALTGR